MSPEGIGEEGNSVSTKQKWNCLHPLKMAPAKGAWGGGGDKLLEEKEKVLQLGPEPGGFWPMHGEVMLRSSLPQKPLSHSLGVSGVESLSVQLAPLPCAGFGKVSHLPASLKSQRIHI